MLEDGEELIVVSRSLGHSTISTTADVYAHVTPATLQRSAERMDGILRRHGDRIRVPRGVRRGIRTALGVLPGAVSRSDGWLARKDSNLRSPDPESGALPLGHSPVGPGF
jgi:hypothetical protein